MNVLQVTKVRNWNGEVQQLYILAKELNRIGVNVFVMCPDQSEIHKRLIDSGISLVTFELNQRKSYKLANFVFEVKKKHNIDLVHLHSSSLLMTSIVYYTIFDRFTPFILAKKSMVRTSSFLSQLKYNHNVIKKIICVSEAVKSTLIGFIWKRNINKVGVLYDGVNVNNSKKTSILNIKERYDLQESDYIVGNIANHVPAKNLEVFVEVANHIVNVLKHKNVKFVQIGGEFKYSKAIYDLSKKYKLEDNLIFMGFVEDASSLLNQFDVLLMTSRREGLPLTIYEAFANKVPVIATKAGGIPEAIIHERTGLLSEIGGYESLASNIISLKDNIDLKNEIIINAERLLFDKYTDEVMGKNTYEIYIECISKNK